MPSSETRSTAPRAQRADARRNIAAILDAAADCLAHDPEISIAGIAAAAGVGRITLYGHFKTRAELVDAVLARTVEHAEAVLGSTDTDGEPAEALTRLVASSWQIVHQFRNILLAAHRELPAERIRDVHDPILRRVQNLIERGQRAGTFRADMPEQWLITTAFSLMHAAAEDSAAGRVNAGDAARLITATLLAAFTPPVEGRTLGTTPRGRRPSGGAPVQPGRSQPGVRTTSA
jgi:TetR/AcrR family transcriptional regulator, mexCD-oprJ operon repressor